MKQGMRNGTANRQHMFFGIKNMKQLRRHPVTRWSSVTAAVITVAIQLVPVTLPAEPVYRPAPINWNRDLPKGLSQTTTPEQRKAIEAQAHKPKPDVRVLSPREMSLEKGRGTYRNAFYGGSVPWDRNIRDASLTTGNLFKSYTDIQVAPAKGAGLALQRTYNSGDSRIGPFGIGWTRVSCALAA